MIGEFVDAWFTVILAAVLWAAAGGGLAALTVAGAARWLCGRWSASQARRAPRVATPPHSPADGLLRPRPLWTHSQPLTYEETA